MNTIRFGGLASGIDTHEMVTQLMNAERLKMNRMLQQEQRTKWRQEAIHDVNQRLANYVLDMRRSFGINEVTYSGNFRASNVSRFDWVKAARSSDEKTVTATANANAMEGVHDVKIDQLASVGRITSNDIGEFLKADGITFKEEYEGKEIAFRLGNSTEVHTFTIGETGTTANQLVSFINGASSENSQVALNAAYDRELGRLMISTKQTGEAQSFTFVEAGADNITNQIFNLDELDENKVKGKNAELYFNGDLVSKGTNDFSVFGVNLSLKEIGEAKVNVSTDVDSVVDKMKEFVEGYNSLLDELNKLTGEIYYAGYPPLTNEDKQSMTDRDIELWEEKSKSGLLRNDEDILRMQRNMRSGLYESVKGTAGSYSQMTQIGITTGNYRDGGKLVIDEEKLRKAISEDVDGVLELMFKTSDATDPKERRDNSGLMQRVNDDIVTGMQALVKRGGTGEADTLFRSVQGNMLLDFITKNGSISQMQRDLSLLNTRIAREETALSRKEERFWAQFTAMEKAMNEMNNQANSLVSMLGQ